MRVALDRDRAGFNDRKMVAVMLDGMTILDNVAPRHGELLLLGVRRHRRVGELTPLPVPPGNGARPEPWRMAAAALFMLGANEVPRRLRRYPTAPLLHALNCGLDCTFTSVAGYLFHAAAGLLDVENAAALEELAARHGPVEPLSWGYALSADGELDFLPVLEDLIDVDDPSLGAALFHATFAQGVAEWIIQAAATCGTRRITLAGDCFENRVLAVALGTRLHRARCEVYAPFTQRTAARAALRGARTIDLEESV